MARVFAYVRVSTASQTPENQIREIEAAGFAVEPRRIIAETISGSIAIARRPGFAKLIDKLETGDVLVVTKLDRLGRDAIDVSATVARLEELGVRVHCLALGGVDLASPAGRMTMAVINAVAQFERDLLIERTQAGLARAKGGRKSPRPARKPRSLPTRQGRRAARSRRKRLSRRSRLQHQPPDHPTHQDRPFTFRSSLACQQRQILSAPPVRAQHHGMAQPAHAAIPGLVPGIAARGARRADMAAFLGPGWPGQTRP
jgi:putative DNA-invertase from lambdoid prophage Rac